MTKVNKAPDLAGPGCPLPSSQIASAASLTAPLTASSCESPAPVVSSSPVANAPIQAVAVVIPARDEESVLPGSLTAIRAALAEVKHQHSEVLVSCRVVLDRCVDASADIVRSHGFEAIEFSAGNVGSARAEGFSRAIASWLAAENDLVNLWLASTDADSLVPENWVTSQLAWAWEGADLVLGTVEPDAHLPALERAAWMARHQLIEGHPHIHGANFGVRASTYVAAGGFTAMQAHEDVDLVRRIRLMEHAVVRSTDRHRVTTSSRTQGRLEGGFATYLKEIREVLP